MSSFPIPEPADAPEPAPQDRPRWARPSLKRYGALRDVVRGAGSGMMEMGGGFMDGGGMMM